MAATNIKYVSLIKALELVQGDSSSTESFSFPAFPDLSSDNWIGTRVIAEKAVGGTVLGTGTLGKSEDSGSFVWFLTPTISAGIATGKQHLTIELKNLVDYPGSPIRLEVVQCPITVKTSGVSNT